MIVSEDVRKAPATIAERSKRHRQRKKNREVQLAFAIAKLVQGGPQDTQRQVLKDYIERYADREVLDDDQLRTVDAAIDKLSARYPRF